MDEALIQSAIDKLEFRDIVLHTCKLERDPDQDPILYPNFVRQQNQHEVITDRLFFIDDDEEEVEILRNYIRFVVSGFEQSTQGEEQDLDEGKSLFSIQAEFRVDYLVVGDLTEPEIDEFSRYNVVHNAWPFWRQHVYQTAGNAKLPRISIPFFRRPPGAPKPRRTKRKRPSKKVSKKS